VPLSKLPEGRSPNELLASLIPNVEIHSFREIIPGMSDIFISLVQQSNLQNSASVIMGTISLIIKREYLTRVRKKTFIIMTILGPVLMASLIHCAHS
jgi:hypothetical protein